MTQLFTDTSANLPIGLALQHKIKILPFSYTVNGVEQPYDPTVEFNGPAYYNAIAAGAEVKTAMINITAFYNAFRPVLAAGHNVLYVGRNQRYGRCGCGRGRRAAGRVPQPKN